MTDLSPAAQAVLDAFRAVPDLRDCPSIAAALRAAADQVVPLRESPKIPFDAPRPTVEWHIWEANRKARSALLAIAAELEGAQ